MDHTILYSWKAKVDVICIDEAKFFDDLYDFYCNVADLDGTTVNVAGQDGDYLSCGYWIKLTARCKMCSRRAFFIFRKTSETELSLYDVLICKCMFAFSTMPTDNPSLCFFLMYVF